MSALNQYLDLYRNHGDIIDTHSAPAINVLREAAYDALKDKKLPKPGSDNYENADLETMLAPDYGLNIAKLDIDVNPAATFHCDVPRLSPHPFLVVNDTFTADAESMKSVPEGVEIGSLREFALKDPETFSRYYGKEADLNNPMTALDTLLAQDGFYLRVKKGVRVEKPLQLVNILQNGMPLMAVRRILIIIEENAEAKLLVCDHTQNPELEFLTLDTVEIFVERNAEFDFYNLEESSVKTQRISTLYLRQEADSRVVIDAMTLYNGTTRNEYYCRFAGENASLRLLGMGIEDECRKVSTYSRIDHAVPRCHSDELFKFSIDEEAKGAFTGRIYVAEGAEKTEAYQSNRNLVGSENARMESKPELEIYNDDVKCSHGSTVGQLDPLQLFYMRTRGLDEATALLLLKQAFMADIIDGVRVDALRDRLHLLVERRFAGASSACASCAGCKNELQ
ncbi:MAG: Fe-S cluster assembly protein SufD [Bacteroides sp.]|nr:Fe-S cluster assembly protein SufD [Bacteroides sp.]MDE7442124.1 Fe-S cluster assembly protein SufD [Muribaculaceae bacterium]